MSSHADAQTLQDIIQYARKHSPYYRDLYKDVNSVAPSLEELPVTDSERYWELAHADAATVLTSPFTDGSPIRSGGSTTVPKMVFITRREIALSGQIMGAAWVRAGLLAPGDVIANLYSFGGMYGGFQYVNKAIENAPAPVAHLPLSSACPLDIVEHEIEAFAATVIIAPVFHITRLADHISKSGRPARSVRMILFSGESLSTSIVATWREVFPHAAIHPSMYSSVDSGGLAVVPRACADADDKWAVDMAVAPIYAVVPGGSVVELLADDGTAITEPDTPGHVFITSLVRRLQPAIRYPVGDLAVWVDYGARALRFLGRGSVAIKIVSSWFDISVLKALLAEVLATEVVGRLQCVLRREGLVSVLIFRLAVAAPADEDEVREKVEARLRELSPSWTKSRDAGRIAPLRFEWVDVSELVFQENSGKLKEIVDERV
ncbi:hypothetical protein VM1G_07351 [Cytospora mali]|uniref:Phenylacetate-coenzyme A ligase n=1 Tax=Cytospora mali TaxID=578113 RepID=A0A194W505_CYTMA|nr:hypothetical protein VM1G_07351 [Valsa mali]